jgi:hypothetical protein
MVNFSISGAFLTPAAVRLRCYSLTVNAGAKAYMHLILSTLALMG